MQKVRSLERGSTPTSHSPRPVTPKGTSPSSATISASASNSSANLKKAKNPSVGSKRSPSPKQRTSTFKAFVEWNEQSLTTEKWAFKHPFEDDAHIELPQPLQREVAGWKRPHECFNTHNLCIVAPVNEQENDEYNRADYIQQSYTTPVLSMGNGAHNNEQLFSKKWMASMFQLLLENSMKIQSGNLLWENIYPKSKEGKPVHNPSGKYCVRVHLYGTWRKITIDDRVPVDAQGNCLFIQTTNPSELWPLLLMKALCKVSSGLQDYELITEEHLYWLTGWMPQITPLSPSAQLSADAFAFNSTPPEHDENTLSSVWSTLRAACVDDSMVVGASTGILWACQREATNSSEVLFANPKKMNMCQMYLVSETSVEGDIRSLRLKAPFGIENHIDPTSPRKFMEDDKYEEEETDVLEESVDDIEASNNYDDAVEPPPVLTFVDFWISLEEFCGAYRGNIIIYNNTEGYDTQYVLDTFQSDINSPVQVPPLLYIESDKPTNLVISASVSRQWLRMPTIIPTSIIGTTTPTLTSTTGSVVVDNSGAETPGAFQATQCVVTLENFKWDAVGASANQLALALKIGTVPTSAVIPVPAGRTVFKLHLSAARGWLLRFSANAQVITGGGYAQILTERLKLTVQEIDGISPKLPESSGWFIWFKHIVHVQSGGVWLWQLSLQDASFGNSVRLHVINNDTMEVFPSLFLTTFARDYQPNQLGYTIMADCRSPITGLGSGALTKWKLRVVSDNNNVVIDPELPRLAQEVEDVSSLTALIANANAVANAAATDGIPPPITSLQLLKSVLRVKEKGHLSVHFSVSTTINSFVYLRLLLWDKSELLHSVEGRNCCVVPNIYLHPQPKKDDDSHKYMIQVLVLRYVNRSGGGSGSGGVGEVPDEAASVRSESRVATNKTRAPRSKSKPKKRTPVQSDDDIKWKLKIISNATVEIKKDTEREDRQTSIKASWEGAGPGRLLKGRVSRERFLQGVTLSPPTLDSQPRHLLSVSVDLKDIKDIKEPPKYVPIDSVYTKSVIIKQTKPDEVPKPASVLGVEEESKRSKFSQQQEHSLEWRENEKKLSLSTKDEFLADLEATRIEMKRQFLSYAERRENYNNQKFPEISPNISKDVVVSKERGDKGTRRKQRVNVQ